MKLYHGSRFKIEKPLYQGSKDDNDYGPAFYLTKDLESAHEWACRNNIVGFVNKYSIDVTKLNILDLTDKTKYSVLNWVAILLHYRKLNPSFINSFKSRLDYIENHYFIDPTQYDIVIGFRADDAYFRFPTDLVRGNITLEQLNHSFDLGELGIQYVLMSQKAIDALKFEECFLSNQTYINKYFDRVNSATEMYDSLSKDEEGTRIFDIIRGNE